MRNLVGQTAGYFGSLHPGGGDDSFHLPSLSPLQFGKQILNRGKTVGEDVLKTGETAVEDGFKMAGGGGGSPWGTLEHAAGDVVHGAEDAGKMIGEGAKELGNAAGDAYRFTNKPLFGGPAGGAGAEVPRPMPEIPEIP